MEKTTNCIVCGKQLTKKQIYNHQKCCSPQCSYKNPERKLKMKNTIKEKYGVDHFSQSACFKEKIKNTWKNKTDEQIKQINDKYEKSMIEKYECKRPLQNKKIKEKHRNTNLTRYGTENVFQNEEIKKKIKQTNLKKYGVDNPRKSRSIQNKSHKTYSYRFMKVLAERFKNYVVFLSDENDYTNFKGNYKWKCVKCGNIFEQHIHKTQFNGKTLYIPRCLKCFPHLKGVSYLENELIDFIKSIYKGKVNIHDKTLIYPNELDIVIPELKIAVQFDGLYWHSNKKGKDENYHLIKTERCLSENYKLIHVFEDEWLYKQEIVKNIIKSNLNIYEHTVDAETCTLKEVNKHDTDDFLQNNHIFGKAQFDISYGLYYDNQLISIITCFNSVLTRFGNKLGYQVVGGLSRLVNALKCNYSHITVEVDRRYFNGDEFKEIGFIFIQKTDPELFYIRGNKRTKIKSSILNKIYDCGKLKYKKEY